MNRRGTAMLIALVALLLTAALATAVLAAARLRWLNGSRQLAARMVLEAAAGSTIRHRVQWNPPLANGLATGETIALPGTATRAGLRYQDSLSRLDSSLFLIRSAVQAIGADGEVMARDGVGELVELTGDSAEPVRRVPRGWWRWP